jgi:hypothetical protein
MSVQSERYFIWHKSMDSFNSIQALMSFAFLKTLCLYICVLITLMLVKLFLFNVNVFVYSCNALHICD